MNKISNELANIDSIVDLIGETPMIRLSGFKGLSADKKSTLKQNGLTPVVQLKIVQHFL